MANKEERASVFVQDKSQDAGVDASKISLYRIASILTVGQWIAVVGAITAFTSTAVHFGSELHPDVRELQIQKNLLSQRLALVDIREKAGEGLRLEDFIAKNLSDTEGLTNISENKLFAPEIPDEWLPLSPSDQGFANDLSLLAQISDVEEAAVIKTFKETSAFNGRNPPKIWSMAQGDGKPAFGKWIPYIQVSIISRDDAQDLMEAVANDSENFFPDEEEITEEIIFPHLTEEGKKLFTERVESFNDPSYLTKLAFEAEFSKEEKRRLFVPATTTDEEIADKTDEIAESVGQAIFSHVRAPMKLAGQGAGSLSEITPEAGLLFGRLLFYVFSVADEGRVDIEYMTLGYNGSYVRTRRETEVEVGDEYETLSVFDDILILATKSDFSLVHIRVPHFDSDLRQSNREIRSWMRQIRMIERR